MKFNYSIKPSCSSRGKLIEWQELLLHEWKCRGKGMSMIG